MKKHELRDALAAAVPEAAPIFGSAMRATLAELARQENERQGTPIAKRVMNKRRALTLVLAVLLLVAAVATAATLLARDLFDVTMGDTPTNAASLTQYNLAKETVGSAEITVREAAYDGMTLYIVYSIRDLTATEPLGAADESGERRLREEDYARIEGLGVGWWWDNLWIDGKSVNMPNMSGGEDLPGEENGEALYYMQYRLDQENVFLDGKSVEIALPIGERQAFESLIRTDEGIAKPEKGMVTFRLDCSSRGQVATEEPNLTTEAAKWRAKVSKVVYTPLQMYVTLDWAVKPEVMAAYIAENGDGYYENGVKLWAYDGAEVCGGEIMSMKLVDEGGKPVFETMRGYYGCKGMGAEQAWYTFPYAERYPEKMYLAPEVGGEVDMAQAVRVK